MDQGQGNSKKWPWDKGVQYQVPWWRLANSNTQTMQSQGLGLHSLQIQFNTNEQECLKTSQEPKK